MHELIEEQMKKQLSENAPKSRNAQPLLPTAKKPFQSRFMELFQR